MTFVSVGCDQPVTLDTQDLSERRLAAGVVREDEGVLGRVVVGEVVLLLTTDRRIVRFDSRDTASVSIPLEGVREDEDLTGFGALADGSLWTLSGWTTLLRIDSLGRVMNRTELARQYTGLHSGFGRLIFQPLDFAGGTPALVTILTVDAEAAVPWGTLRVRTGSEAGPIRLGLSLAKCGLAAGGRMPCWLAGDAAVELINDGGEASKVPLPSLEKFVIDSTAFTSHPHRVIRDAWLTSEELWILSRADLDEMPDRRGQHGLWRFSTAGEVIGRYRLPTAARLILGVAGSEVRLLTSSGDIVAAEG